MLWQVHPGSFVAPTAGRTVEVASALGAATAAARISTEMERDLASGNATMRVAKSDGSDDGCGGGGDAHAIPLLSQSGILAAAKVADVHEGLSSVGMIEAEVDAGVWLKAERELVSEEEAVDQPGAGMLAGRSIGLVTDSEVDLEDEAVVEDEDKEDGDKESEDLWEGISAREETGAEIGRNMVEITMQVEAEATAAAGAESTASPGVSLHRADSKLLAPEVARAGSDGEADITSSVAIPSLKLSASLSHDECYRELDGPRDDKSGDVVNQPSSGSGDGEDFLSRLARAESNPPTPRSPR